jgi:hypothetical protein
MTNLSQLDEPDVHLIARKVLSLGACFSRQIAPTSPREERGEIWATLYCLALWNLWNLSVQVITLM